MEKSENQCPFCKFDYSSLEPHITLIQCPDCGKSYADISRELIRILY